MAFLMILYGGRAPRRSCLAHDPTSRQHCSEQRLRDRVAELLAEAARIDAEEDKEYGVGRRGDELPEELQHAESRLARIRAAKAALEAEAKQQEVGVQGSYPANDR